ncbi:uncharacterized protein VTP21DRAFT_5507 [Calcarisporiella thermophila]|uniref:uncharacterized protein n=1 Tax=Calcarisporiella thermophila TaxID=911321 RepID=UPI00374212A7
MLPADCIYEILRHVDDPLDLARFSRVSREWSVQCNSNILWKRFCEKRSVWKIWNTKFPDTSSTSYKSVFIRRLKIDRDILCLLREIERTSLHRNHNIKLIGDFGLEAEDILKTIIRSKSPLSQRYWARKTLRYMRRRQVREQWIAFRKGEREIAVWYGMALIASFGNIECTTHQVDERIEELAKEFREEEVDTVEEDARFNALVRYFCEKKGFRGNVANYYAVANNYIDQVLKSHTGLPLTLSILFQAIAERVGVHVDAINFPQHFLLRYRQNGFLDVFQGGICYTLAECQQMLRDMGLATTQNHFVVAEPRAIFYRCLINLYNAVLPDANLGLPATTLHAALTQLFAIMDNPPLGRLRTWVVATSQCFPEDAEYVLERMRELNVSEDRPEERILIYELERVLEEDSSEPEIVAKRRREKSELYSVGTIFDHRRYGYTAVIYGWDEECSASEQWILQMQVDTSLARGRHQPFYNVFVEDGSSRYVAHDNIVVRFCNDAETQGSPTYPLGSATQAHDDYGLGNRPGEDGPLYAQEEIGAYFERFDPDTFRYIPSAELRARYPDG